MADLIEREHREVKLALQDVRTILQRPDLPDDYWFQLFRLEIRLDERHRKLSHIEKLTELDDNRSS